MTDTLRLDYPPGVSPCHLTIDGIDIAGLHYCSSTTDTAGGEQATPGQPSPALPRLLCLHGWLDNAASFVPLMPCLPALDIVAIDLPGHGHSGALAEGYSLVSMMRSVVDVMDALGWDRCHLMGHSMGGCIAPLVAAARPSRIESLLMLEASGPLTEEADAYPARLNRVLDDHASKARFQSRAFASAADAVAARLRAARMSAPAAELIVHRQLVAGDDADNSAENNTYRWRFDPRLRMASPYYLTEAHVIEVLRAVPCPTLTVVADQGFLARRPETPKRLAALRHHTSVTLPGWHHLHMDTPEPVANCITQFLRNNARFS